MLMMPRCRAGEMRSAITAEATSIYASTWQPFSTALAHKSLSLWNFYGQSPCRHPSTTAAPHAWLIHRILSPESNIPHPPFQILNPDSWTITESEKRCTRHLRIIIMWDVATTGERWRLWSFGVRVKWRGCQIKFPAPILGDSAPAAGSAICFDNTKTNPQSTRILSRGFGEIDSLWMGKGKPPPV